MKAQKSATDAVAPATTNFMINYLKDWYDEIKYYWDLRTVLFIIGSLVAIVLVAILLLHLAALIGAPDAGDYVL